MNSEGLGKMFDGDIAEMCTNKIPLLSREAERRVKSGQTRERGPPSAEKNNSGGEGGQKSGGGGVRTNISDNSQQPMRKFAFEVISQSETKSTQSRKPRRERNNA